MSDMKCPFCQQELVEIQFGEQRYWSCINDRCDESVGFGGNLKLWQELIRTRKALDVAVDALGYYASENSWDETNRWMFVENGFEFARDVLVKIDKTLEQKDVK